LTHTTGIMDKKKKAGLKRKEKLNTTIVEENNMTGE